MCSMVFRVASTMDSTTERSVSFAPGWHGDGLADADPPLGRERKRSDRHVRDPEQPAGKLPEQGERLLGAHDRHRKDGARGPKRELHEAAPPEALELVAVAEGLADALDALGKDEHWPPLGEQARGAVRRGPYRAQPVEERAQERGVEHLVLGQPPRLGQVGALAA